MKNGEWIVSVPIRSISRVNLALPLGELSPKVTERVLQSGIPSPSSLRSATFPKGRGKGVLMVLFGSRQSPDFFAGLPTYEMGM